MAKFFTKSHAVTKPQRYAKFHEMGKAHDFKKFTAQAQKEIKSLWMQGVLAKNIALRRYALESGGTGFISIPKIAVAARENMWKEEAMRENQTRSARIKRKEVEDYSTEWHRADVLILRSIHNNLWPVKGIMPGRPDRIPKG